jgi:hypothetical protein
MFIKNKEVNNMVNVVLTLPIDKYQKLYRQLQIDSKTTMSDIINRYIDKGFEYEQYLKDEEDEASI